jgi:hypothetical protein
MADTVTTLRPNGDAYVGSGWTIGGGSGSHNAAQSDNNDATYSAAPASGGDTLIIDFATFVFPALSQIRSVTMRARSATSGATGQGLYAGMSINGGATRGEFYYNKASSAAVTDSGSAQTDLPDHSGGWTQSAVDGLQAVFQEYNNVAGLRILESYMDVAYNRAPTGTPTLPTGSVTTTSKPTIQWSYTDPELDTQERAQVKIFLASAVVGVGGFDPETSTPLYNSTELLQAGASHAITTPLTPGIAYKAYVKVADVGSSGRYGLWTAGPSFTIVASAGLIFDPPATPAVLTATADATNNRFSILVQGQDNELSRNQSSGETSAVGLFADTNIAATYPQRSTAQFSHGVASFLVRSNAAGNMVLRTTSALTLAALAVEAMKVTPGLTYAGTVECRQAAVAAGRTIQAQINWYTAAGAAASTPSNIGGAVAVSTAGFTQATVVATAPANALYAVLFPTIVGAVAASEDFYLDKLMISPGPGTVWTRGGFTFPMGSVIDTFTRADNAAAMGNSEGPGTPVWSAGGGTWGIQSNQAYLASATANGVAYVITNQLVDGVITTDVKLSGTANRADAGIVFRGADGINFLLVRIQKLAAVDAITLYKNVAGTYTSLGASAALGLINGTTYGLKVEFFGGKVRAYLDKKDNAGYTKVLDVDMIVGDVAAYSATANMRTGIWINNQAGQDDGGTRFDNYNAQLPDVQRLYIERSLDGGVTWALARFGNGLDPTYPGQQVTFFDYEVGPGVTPQYRAYAKATESDQTMQSATSGTVAGSGPITLANWWLKDPLDPTRNMIILVAPPFNFKKQEPQQIYQPLGRATAVFVTDGVKGIAGTLTVYSKDKATYDKLQTLVNAGRVLQLQDPFGRSAYVKISGDQEWDMTIASKLPSETTPIRHYHTVRLPFEETAIPAVV